MIIKLCPVRSDYELSVAKSGDTLILNGVSLDFSRLEDGATLPAEAVGSTWVSHLIERINGELVITIILPHTADAPEFARFPADIVSPADGPVHLPGIDAEPVQQPAVNGLIDWSQVITQAMKDQAVSEQRRALVVAESAARRVVAARAIAPLQDAVDLADATEAEVASLKAWKQYRVALSRVPEQDGYPDAIEWPPVPA